MNLKTEPASLTNATVGLVTAVVGLLVAFNINVTPEQRDAIIVFVLAAGVFIAAAGLFIRKYVWSPASHDAAVLAAINDVTPPATPTTGVK